MIQEKYDVSSIKQLSSVALELLSLSDNRIFALHGDLGAGKTTLVKQFCTHLQVVDSVSSPTFSLVNEYINIDGVKIFHFDLYRVNDISELIKMGVDTYFNSGEYCFIEWPAIVEPLLLNSYYNNIKIVATDNKRELYLLE
jgi:tRNA threonylcarbamoyladenosine biosynthesis protein TsaE